MIPVLRCALVIGAIAVLSPVREPWGGPPAGGRPPGVAALAGGGRDGLPRFAAGLQTGGLDGLSRLAAALRAGDRDALTRIVTALKPEERDALGRLAAGLAERGPALEPQAMVRAWQALAPEARESLAARIREIGGSGGAGLQGAAGSLRAP